MEKYKKGGYTILDLESSTIYADSVKALDSNKPVVVYDGANAPYFADTISLSGTSVVITKGGKTITIANDNTITNVGDIQTISYRKKVFLYFTHSEENDVTLLLLINENDKNEILTPTEATQDLYVKYVKSNVGVVGLDDNGEQIVALYECTSINNNTFNIAGNNTDQYVFDRIEIHLI